MKGKIRMIVWVIMIFGLGAVALYIDSRLFNEIFSSWIFHLASFIIGMPILLFTLRVSKVTGWTLARYGREGQIERFETNKLVTQGPYQYMRHPMHFGLLFMPLAWGFLLGSPTFLLLFAPLEIIFILVMIKVVEEPEAKKKFGQEYEQFCKDRPWFCIKPECIKALLFLPEELE